MNKKCFSAILSKILAFGSLALVGGMFFSCGEDSGLGSQIDTKSPVLSIDYPPSSAVVRDTFTLQGTCSDDKSIARVIVTVKSIDEDSSSDSESEGDSYLATVSADQSYWYIDLNKPDDSSVNGWQYADGKYEVSVTAYDNAGNNSGKSSRTFEIDNSAPLFIISNPGVVKKSGYSASAYGSIFTITGTISDTHSISYMDVAIYDASTNKLVSEETYEGEALSCYREEDIATAGGSSVTIAQWVDDSDSSSSASGETNPLGPRYTQLYGEDKDAGTKGYYAQITLYDSAKVYQNPPKNSSRSVAEVAEDELGNGTSSLYLYDDVYTTLMSQKKGKGLSASDLRDILAGTREDADTLAYLKEKVVDTSEAEESDALANKLYFSLNPQANPTYTVNGFALGDTVQTASSGNALSITISAGLDGTNIAPEDVKVWLRAFTESEIADRSAISAEMVKLNQEVLQKQRSEAEFKAVENLDEELSSEAVNKLKITDSTAELPYWSLIYDYGAENEKGSSVTTKTFSIVLPEGIQLSYYYVVAITGADVEDVEFSQSSLYGFKGNTAGVAPTLSVTKPANLSITNDLAGLVFEGTAEISSTSLFVKKIEANITVADEANANASVGTGFHTEVSRSTAESEWKSDDGAFVVQPADEKGVIKWTFQPSKIDGCDAPSGEVQYLYTIDFVGTSSSSHVYTVTSAIHLDTKKPVVTVSSVEPRVEDFDSTSNIYLNGTITVKGNVEEANLSTVTYDIWASNDDDLTKTLTKGDSVLAKLKAKDANAFSGELGRTFSVSKTFDTTQITSLFATDTEKDPKIKLDIVLYAKDTAGNVGEYHCLTDSTLLGASESGVINPLVIYQETDRPKITLGNADLSYEEKDGTEKSLLVSGENFKNINTEHNLFGTTTNNKLQISFSDDDSVNTIFITVYDASGAKVADSKTFGGLNPYSVNPKKTTYSLNYTLPEAEGVYRI